MKTTLMLALLASAAPALPAFAQAGPSDYTTYTRYDAQRRVTGTISPDPDGAGPMKHRASRNRYDAAGRLERTERGTLDAWQPETVAPAAWPGFTVLAAEDFAHDALDRRTRETRSGPSTGSGQAPAGQMEVQTLTQTSYDLSGRAECTAVRMNQAAYGTLPASACTPGFEGAFGPDRITRNVYDAAGQLLQIREAVGTPLEQAEATFAYSLNGQRNTIIDGNGNRTAFRYDGHDRLVGLVFPSPTPPTAFVDTTPAQALASAGAVNENDHEDYTLDPNGNRVGLRLRDGQSIAYTFDAMNRLTFKDVPGTAFWENDVTYRYDLRGLQTYAGDSGDNSVGSVWDAAGRRTAEINNWFGTIGSQYDADGNRTRLTYRDGFAIDYDYLATGEMRSITESGSFLIARFAYDDLGRRTSLYRGNDKWTTYAYDGASRLKTLGHGFASPAHDLALTFAYSPASQIALGTRSNDLYAHPAAVAGEVASAANGLNQLTQSGGTARTHDLRGNVTSDGSRTYGYTAENRLSSSSPGGILAYDPLGRLFHIQSSVTNFGYDGDAVVEETVSSGGALRTRWVHGPGVDEPIMSYDANGSRTWYHADERGSIIAASDAAGNAVSIGTYDEYGVPGANNTGRFSYTGQLYLPEVQLHSYKARMYRAPDGRFMQTDPVGYDDQYNLYAYVGGDPVNATDSTGLCGLCIKVGKVIWKGGDVASVMAGAAADVATIVSPGASPMQKLGAGLSLITEVASPVSARDAKAAVSTVGKAFTRSQKSEILQANRTRNDGALRSDKSGVALVPSQKSQKGVTPAQNEAQVDHIQPRSKGGTNDMSNAQVLSREENRNKSDKWELK